MKLLNAFFVVIFTISAVIQYNDPDPLLWMAIYGYGALVCLLALLGKDHIVLHYAGILIFLTYALYLFFVPDGVLSWITEHDAENITGSMSEEKPWVESTREFFGLLILSFALLLNLIFRKNKNQPNLNATQ
ncbi:transmembrane 220 family protein [Salinimicrobium xinjiangense]|uniref:transmembrane 220 family protein n=1 Tax=Salinimicrobium xinjiangense TaxID=438596 RepID=UPI0006860808|nr:transmembrane 220 family protein [Salinimicrobium xinjiangense]